jgi:hypothetical protein
MAKPVRTGDGLEPDKPVLVVFTGNSNVGAATVRLPPFIRLVNSVTVRGSHLSLAFLVHVTRF